MKSEFKYIRLIERFINKEVSDREREQFINELRINKRLAFEFGEYQNLITSLKDQDAIELRRQLKKLYEDESLTTQSKFSNYLMVNRIILMAALVLLIISIGFIARLIFLDQKLPEFTVVDNLADSLIFLPDSAEHYTANNICADSTDAVEIVIVPEQIKKEYKTPRDAITKVSIAELTGSNYQLTPIYAELVSSNLRSGNFHLHEPKDSAIFQSGDPITFLWETNSYNEIFLEILNNQGGRLFQARFGDVKKYIWEQDLDSGIYIIKFKSSREFLDISIFYIY